MRKLIFVLIITLYFGSCYKIKNLQKEENPLTSPISLEHIKANLMFLASDALEGRDTASKGEELASLFLSSELKKYGVKPFVEETNYVQDVELKVIRFKEESKFQIVDDGSTLEDFEYITDFVGGSRYYAKLDTTLSLVFAGYGITAQEYGYDDYDSLDVEGKIVLVLADEPISDDTTYFKGPKKTLYSYSNKKVSTAAQHGALGVILLSSIEKEDSWENLVNSINKGQLKLVKDTLTPLRTPTVYINENTLRKIMNHSSYSYEKVISQIPKFEFPFKIKVNWEFRSDERKTAHNVIGIIEGNNPDLKNEYVALGAHYDHVGYSGKDIYNGADDNASGTVAVLEAAKAIAMSKANERSILVFFFSGEEKGLLGSKYIADTLRVMEDVVALINLDMVGRGPTDSIYCIGSDKISSELHKLVESANKENVGLFLDYKFDAENDPERLYYRSDHYNFAKKNIPIVFFYDDMKEDYHKTSDDADKINYEKVTKIVRLTYHILLKIANQDHRLVADRLATQD